jgi:hypothetical protein
VGRQVGALFEGWDGHTLSLTASVNKNNGS